MNQITSAKMLFKSLFVLVVLFLLLMVPQQILSSDSEAGDKSAPLNHASVDYPISSPYYPVALTGENLPSLQDVPIGNIAMYAVHDNEFKPIPFQIDRKDKKGKFQIPVNENDEIKERTLPFDGNDECVFMAIDVGKKVESVPEIPGMLSAAELEITDPKTGEQAWVYALVFEGTPPESSDKDYVSYQTETDTIETDYYRIGFIEDIPIFMNMIRVKPMDSDEYSPDIIDIMKVKHMGKFLHRFDFVRTQADFTSKLVAVKDGPVRVIRRTASKVRLFLGLKTPSVLTDYIQEFPQKQHPSSSNLLRIQETIVLQSVRGSFSGNWGNFLQGSQKTPALV